MSTFTHIKTSLLNRKRVTELTRKLQLGPENVIARIAIAYSLSKDVKFDLSDMQNAAGKEYSANVLFGNNLTHYVAMIANHYNIYKTNKDLPKYIKMHLDDGLELIDDELMDNPNLDGFDFLVNKIDEGLTKFQ